MSNTADHSLLEAARASYQAILALYLPLDKRIAQSLPHWDPTSGFVSELARICENLALAMLGADHVFTDEEISAFNTIFAQEASSDSVRTRALATGVIQEEVLFERIDRFVLDSVQADQMLAQDLTSQALDYFMSLGEVMAVIDHHYHREENLLYQHLLGRIRKDWQDVHRFIAETEPTLLITLKDGSKKPFRF